VSPADRPHPVRRAVTTLADGRRLIYFDEPGAPDRTAARDTRPPAPFPAAGTVRHDVRTGAPVVFAPARADRTFDPAGVAADPLAPSTPGSPTEIPAEDFDVVVFDNRFPALGPPGGAAEVLVYSPDPVAGLADLGARRMATVIEAWVDRTTELAARDGVREVFCFENRGPEIGVTLAHPHGQIYAYPFLTPDTAAVLGRIRAHRDATGGDLLGEALAAELASGRRVIARGTHWAAYVPYAARWPVEVEVAPLRAVPDLPSLHHDERAELAEFYPALLRRLDRFFPGDDGRPLPLPYVASWHQGPVGADGGLWRLHLRVFSVRRAPDRLKYLAASESARGVWISDTTPEQIADRLREVGP